MTYVVNVPFEVARPISEADPDVRSLRRVPGFVRLEADARHRGRYQLTFEVEGGSLRDATDAAEELFVEYEDALGAYRPRLLEAVAPAAI
jgi:hypothetical protein